MNASRDKLSTPRKIGDAATLAIRATLHGADPVEEAVDGHGPVPVPAPVREGGPTIGLGGAQEAVDGPVAAAEGGDAQEAGTRAQEGAQAQGTATALYELDRAIRSYAAALTKLAPRQARLAEAITAYLAANGDAADVRSRIAVAGIHTEEIPRVAREVLKGPARP